MIARMEIIGLEEQGDSIKVRCQGKALREAEWQPFRVMTLDVPPHIGKRYKIGQILKLKVVTK
jgi:hypothetical protein